MPERKTIEKAKKQLRAGKSPSTAAGEFIREEIEHEREGKHPVRSRKQAIAIGLAKARRAGVPLPPRAESAEDARVRRELESAYRAGKKKRKTRAGTAARRSPRPRAP